MIIKTFTRKNPDFGTIINYITEERSHKSHPIRFFHHVPARCIADVTSFFETNDQYRKPRQNGNALYHTILSFHEQDNRNLSPSVLRDLMQQYFSLRAPQAPCFAQSHHDQDHIHVHALIAGNQYKSPISTRQSRSAFYQLRTKLEAYQQETYPELTNSLVYGHMRDFERTKTTLLKHELTKHPLPFYEEASGYQSFLASAIAVPNLTLFVKHGQPSFLWKRHTFTAQEIGIDLSLLRDLEVLHRLSPSRGRLERDR